MACVLVVAGMVRCTVCAGHYVVFVMMVVNFVHLAVTSTCTCMAAESTVDLLFVRPTPRHACQWCVASNVARLHAPFPQGLPSIAGDPVASLLLMRTGA
jgi:hypothetical protein